MIRNYGESSITWEDGPFSCGFVVAHKVLCDDGKRRTAHPATDGIADTFFSIPAFVYAQGKRVYGYIGQDVLDVDGDYVPVVRFHAYLYRKHHALVAAPNLPQPPFTDASAVS